MAPTSHWPPWWVWDLELSPHIEKRMADRGFTELVREMMHDAQGYREDVVEGSWIIDARLRGRAWEIVVEPDDGEQLLVAVTAYPVE